MTEALPRISVVIPTVMRETLSQAIDSALRQSCPPAEVIVVFDLDRVPDEFQPPAGPVRVLLTGGNRGANTARRLGVDAASGDAIALLDDDDYWYPGKLAAQAGLLQAARQNGALAVVSTNAQVIDPAGRELDLGHQRVIREGQTISDYLFKRRHLRWGEMGMGPSSLLVDREILRAVPFPEGIEFHEDWDWLLRVGSLENVRFMMVPRPLLAYRRQPHGMSLSRSSQWPYTIRWADERRQWLSPREYGDFLLGVGVPRAVDGGARWGGLRVALHALYRGRPGPVAIAAAAGLLLLPRSAPDIYARYRRFPQRVLRRMRQGQVGAGAPAGGLGSGHGSESSLTSSPGLGE